MAVNKNFVVKNGLEVKSNLLVADTSQDSVGIGTSYIKEKLHVIGGIGATSLFVGGIGTVHVASGGTARYDNATISGVATASGLNVLGITSTKDLNVVGVITAGSYSGDGSGLSGVSVGVRTAGSVAGYGVTLLDFRGSGVSTGYYNSNVGIATVWFSGGGSGGSVSISSAAPTNPSNGDLWYSIDYGRTFVYYDEVELGVGSTSVWVDASPFNAGGKFLGAYGATSYGAIGNTAGTKTVPSWHFTADSNTGIFQGGTADHLSFAAGGSGIATVNVGGLAVSGVVTSHSLSLSGDATVAGNINVTGDLVYNEERGVNLLISGVGTFGGAVNIADSIVHTGDTDTKLRFPSADTITAETGGSERLRVTSAGKVGINQATPEALLHVEASSSGASYTADAADTLILERNGGCVIDFRTPAANDSGLIFSDTSRAVGTLLYNHSNNTLAFGVNGGEKLRITSGGDVGIGTLVAQDSSGLTTKLAVGIVTAATLYGDGSNLTGIAAGGSGEFNTSISGATAYDVTTSMATAYTANASSSHRTIVHSIHVANVGSSDATISGEIQASFSFAHTIPVPAGSAVELLKQPKVLGPSETIELQGSTSDLRATIIVEYKEDTDYWDAQVDITSAATWTDLYTSTSNPSVVQSILLANDDGTNDVKARVAWTDGSDSIQQTLIYDLVVPADSSVEICEKPKYLPSGHKLRVYANVADRLEVTASGKQITS